MTTRVTMIQTRRGDSGATLSAGSTYSIRDELADGFVGSNYATYADPLNHWRRRTNGGRHGQVREFGPIDASLSHYLPFEAQWNANDNVWEPRGGRVLLLCADPLTGSSAANCSVAVPDFQHLADLLGTKLGYEFDLQLEGSANGPTARSLILTFGSTQFLNESTALHRRFGMTRTVRNKGATNAQSVTNKLDAEYAPYQSANSQAPDMAEETAGDLVIAASSTIGPTANGMAYTYAAPQTLTRKHYKVWWVK